MLKNDRNGGVVVSWESGEVMMNKTKGKEGKRAEREA